MSVEMQDIASDLWVFGYGSLMWRPGFPFAERRHAQLYGYHRALCVFSHVHRGTPEKPGLVLGLDRGGRCHGVAFRVVPEEVEATVHYLREREQATAVYLERRLPVRLDDSRRVTALAYVADRKHPQYAGRLAFDEILRLVRAERAFPGSIRTMCARPTSISWAWAWPIRCCSGSPMCSRNRPNPRSHADPR